ncbi:MAG: ROK family transcriptional regulator [Firmicutes bacterium]|nr:ROK family transcriptional regulator [Bacillota bacterium]
MRVEASILRKLNERRVLNAIRVGKTVSRADIQRKLSITMPTVSKIVDELITQGWVMEVGTGDFTLGRPPVMLEINPSSAVAIGIDIGRFCIRVVSVNLLAQVIAQKETSVEDIGTVDELLSRVDLMLVSMGVDPSGVLGIGIASPGSRNPHPDSPQRPGTLDEHIAHRWHRAALDEYFTRRYGVPSWMENDANAAVLGEIWFGSAQSCNHLVFVFADEGLGAGIAVNGSIYTGESNVAGEFAHMIVNLDGGIQCECKRPGCLGGVAHLRGIREELRQSGMDLEEELFSVFARGASGHEPEYSVICRAVDYLAIGIFNLIQVIDPSHVIVGGGMFRLDPFVLKRLNERVQELCYPKRIPLLESSFGVNAVAVGAATLVLQHLYDHTKLVNLTVERVDEPLVRL